MAEAAEPLLQVIEADGNPLNLYADDDAAHIIRWILANRPLLGLKTNYKIVIDVGGCDVTGTVAFNLLRLTKAA